MHLPAKVNSLSVQTFMVSKPHSDSDSEREITWEWNLLEPVDSSQARAEPRGSIHGNFTTQERRWNNEANREESSFRKTIKSKGSAGSCHYYDHKCLRPRYQSLYFDVLCPIEACNPLNMVIMKGLHHNLSVAITSPCLALSVPPPQAVSSCTCISSLPYKTAQPLERRGAASKVSIFYISYSLSRRRGIARINLNHLQKPVLFSAHALS